MPPTKYDRSLLAIWAIQGNRQAHTNRRGSSEVYQAGNFPGDLLIEATFSNPYLDPNLEWEHGFFFKAGESNHFYKLSIESDGDWERYAKRGSGNYIGILGTNSPELKTAPRESNLLQLALVRGIAWVYINGSLAGNFPADIDTGGDWVSLFVYDEHEGSTQFKDFAVWRWHSSMHGDFPEVNPNYVPPPTPTPTITPTPNPKLPIFGPVSGRIQHDEGDGRYEFFDGPNIDGDIMIEVTFEVPFTPQESHWNFGIWFDSSKPGAYHVAEINSLFGGSYNHWRKSGSGESRQGRRSEDVIGINFQKGETNHVRVILIDREAWLYVNDRRMGILNFSLGDIPAPNWVGLVIEDFDGQGFRYSRGGHTKFEDFTVWRWHPSLFDLPKDD